MPTALPAFDLYAELGIDPACDGATVAAAYRAAAKAAHPDVSGAEGATGRMTRLNVARDVLLDDELRARYDASRGLLSRTRRPVRRPGSRQARSDETADDPLRDRGSRAPAMAECPICSPAQRGQWGHCALGHAGQGPRFGGPRRFAIDPAEHGDGRPFTDFRVAEAHARSCDWFASNRGYGVSRGWAERPEFPAAGRIRKADRVALDPAVLVALARHADARAVIDALDYAVAGRVLLLARYGMQLRALVCGRHAYNVELRLADDGTLNGASCDCLSYREVCKHSLATWLVFHYVEEART